MKGCRTESGDTASRSLQSIAYVTNRNTAIAFFPEHPFTCASEGPSLGNAQLHRERAVELLSLAREASDLESCISFRELAALYDRLAQWVEKQTDQFEPAGSDPPQDHLDSKEQLVGEARLPTRSEPQD